MAGNTSLDNRFDLDELSRDVFENRSTDCAVSFQNTSVASFVQSLAMNKETCSLRIQHKDTTGYFIIRAGDIIFAHVNDATGETAALEMIGWNEAAIDMIYKVPDAAAVLTQSLNYLLSKTASGVNDDSQRGAHRGLPQSADQIGQRASVSATHSRQASNGLLRSTRQPLSQQSNRRVSSKVSSGDSDDPQLTTSSKRNSFACPIAQSMVFGPLQDDGDPPETQPFPITRIASDDKLFRDSSTRYKGTVDVGRRKSSPRQPDTPQPNQHKTKTAILPSICISRSNSTVSEQTGVSEQKQQEGTIIMDISKLQIGLENIKKSLGSGILAADIFGPDGMSLVGFGAPPQTSGAFLEVTRQIKDKLHVAGFPEMGRYYIIELVEKKMIVVIHYKDFQWGVLVDLTQANMGLLITVAVPQAIKDLQAAINA